MSTRHQCPLCFENFSCLRRLQSHLKRKIPCHATENNINSRQSEDHICPSCGKNFARGDSLARHIKANICQSNEISDKQLIELEAKLRSEMKAEFNELKEKSQTIEKQMAEMAELKEKSQIFEKQMAELIKDPRVINNNLQIVCVNNDNYLDMLTEEFGNFERALTFIKDCALASLSGDCRLLEKIYLNKEKPSIYYPDGNRKKMTYFNEKKEKVIDPKGEILARKLANNLQNSYLKGVNYLINKNLENRMCPNKFLEEYDLQIWNRHIYELSDVKYQKKIIKQLDIPDWEASSHIL